jgi:hypothetical protein
MMQACGSRVAHALRGRRRSNRFSLELRPDLCFPLKPFHLLADLHGIEVPELGSVMARPSVCIQDDHVPAVFECHSENLLEEAPAEVSEIPAVEAEGCLSGDAGLRFGEELAIGEEAADDFTRMSDLPTHELQPHLAPPGRLSFSRPAARRLDAVVLGGILRCSGARLP